MKFSVNVETNGKLGSTLRGRAQDALAKAKGSKPVVKAKGAVQGWKQS